MVARAFVHNVGRWASAAKGPRGFSTTALRRGGAAWRNTAPHAWGPASAAAAAFTTALASHSEEESAPDAPLSAPEMREPWPGVLDTVTTGVSTLSSSLSSRHGGQRVADGRGVVVCVMDTGVDPAAQGLRTTPQGRAKMVDVIDATGAGDVDVSKKVKADADGWILNEATGRKVRVDASKWTVNGRPGRNPADGEWRVGAKAAAALWPKPVLDRRAHEAKKSLDALQRGWRARARADRDAAKDDKTKDYAEMQARVDEIERAAKSLAPTRESSAPLLDVLVWLEPSLDEGCAGTLRAVVFDGAVEADLTSGAASGVKALADFHESYLLGEPETARWATFGAADLLTYSLSFYDGGNVATIVTPAGDHGTHVAAIVAAFVEGDAEKTGVAPAAQIVSIKIGDSRLGTMETGAGLARALIAAKRHGCDVINLSYGEAATLCDAGRFATRANELVHDSGAIFLASAGNNGPALSTVGAPGGTTSGIIGVGAYVNPNMCADLYAMRKPAINGGGQGDSLHGGVMYSFSSRGPAPDGDWGVSVCAPGGAVASVPAYTLQPQRLMHGTSMSSPNAAGSVACLLSALQAEAVPYSAASVRRAIESSARKLSGVPETDQGAGVLAVDLAFELLAAAPCRDRDVRYEVRVPERAVGATGAPHARGIYLREPFETATASEISVSVMPKFHNDGQRPSSDKAEFQRAVKLVSSAPDWVQCGERMVLAYGGKAVNVLVDPSKAPLGVGQGPLCAQVVGYDADFGHALFRIPITLVKPVASKESFGAFAKLPFSAGHIERRFVAPPRGATSATLKLSCSGAGGSGKRMVHISTIQLSPQEAYNSQGYTHKRVWVNDGDSVVVDLADLAPERTLEVCISQDWNSLEDCEMTCDVNFKAGGSPVTGGVVLRGTRSVAKVELGSPGWASAGSTVAAPLAKLRKWRRPLRPIKSSIVALSDSSRDEWTQSKRYYDLNLEYSWTHPAGASDGVTLRFAGDELIYDAPFDGQHAKITDDRGKVLAWRDSRVFGEAKGFDAGRKYTATLTVRHDDSALLEQLRDAECWIEMPLAKDVCVPAYATRQAAYAGDKRLKARDARLKPGEQDRCAFLAPPAESDLPKDAAAGDVLLGTVSYARSPSLSEGSARRASEALMYFVPPRSQKTAEKDKPKKKTEDDSDKDKDAAPSDTAAALKSLPTAFGSAVLDAFMADASNSTAVGLLQASRQKALQTLADATFDKQLEILKTLDVDVPAHSALADHLSEQRPDKEVAVRRAALSFVAGKASAAFKKRSKNETSCALDGAALADDVLAAAGKLRSALDENKIALHCAKRVQDDDLLFDPNATKTDEANTHEGDKAALLEAMRWAAEAKLAKAFAPAGDVSVLPAFADSVVELEAWVDLAKAGGFGDARLRAQLDAMQGRPGRALKTLATWLDSKKGKTAHDDDVTAARNLRASLFRDLGWAAFADAEEAKLAAQIPNPKIS